VSCLDLALLLPEFFSWREGVLNAGIEDGAVEEKKQN